ncbi:TF26 protein, partial [Pseudoatta argentina]
MFRFDDEQKNAFQKLKTILSQEPLLKLYRVGADTELHTDASSYGFGAILCQRDDQDRLFHPVCYASWKTSEAESRYSSYELERCDGDLLLVIPKSMQVDIIKQTHERGHFGVRKTEQLLKREFWFSEMRKKIDKVIKNCITCILAERKHGKQEGFLRNIPKNAIPLETYHIDHLGRVPIPSTQKSYAHILVVVDAFTKFTWLYPTKSTSAEEVINRLSKQAVIFGNPCQIVSDRSTAFTSKSFKKYCADEKIEHILTYSIGDLVAIKRTQITPGSKLYPKYLGPYQIIHVLRGDRYVLSKVGEHEGPRSTTTSSDNIKRWLVNECDSNVDTSGEDTDNEDGHQGPMPLQNGRDVGPAENV